MSLWMAVVAGGEVIIPDVTDVVVVEPLTALLTFHSCVVCKTVQVVHLIVVRCCHVCLVQR